MFLSYDIFFRKFKIYYIPRKMTFRRRTCPHANSSMPVDSPITGLGNPCREIRVLSRDRDRATRKWISLSKERPRR